MKSIKQISKWLLSGVGGFILIFGFVSFVVARTIDQEIAGVLVAIFGLLVVWFICWIYNARL